MHIPRTFEELQPGDHLCCIYETEDQHRAVLAPFLRQGLLQGEKVLYIVDEHTAEGILDYLRDGGLDVESFIDRGQLNILTSSDTYMKNGLFDPAAMIALLKSETELALAEGYSALRVTGEMTWALRGLPGTGRLIEYETRLNYFLPGSSCLAICQYDRRRFGADVLLDVLRTHPVAIIGMDIYENFYYVPPEKLADRSPIEMELQRWITSLAERKRAKQALYESAALLNHSQEIAAMGSFIWNISNDSLIWSRNMYVIHGLDKDTFAGNLTDISNQLIHPDDRNRVKSEIERMIQTGRVWSMEFRIVRPDGEERFMRSSGEFELDEAGKPVKCFGVHQDITERKQATEELYAKTRLLESVRKAQSLYITGDDPQPVFDELLKTLVSLTGSEFGFLDQVLHDDDGTPYKQSLSLSNIAWDHESELLYEQLRAHNLEFRNLYNLSGLPVTLNEPVIANDAAHDTRSGGLPPGHPPIHSFMGLPVLAGGEMVGVIGVANRRGGYSQATARFLEPYLNTCAGIIQSVRLRTREREAVDALRKNEEKYRLFVDTANEGIWSIDADHVTTYINQAMADMLGYSTSEMLENEIDSFFFPQDLPSHKKRLRMRRDNIDETYVQRFRRRDNSTLWAIVSAKALQDDQGRFAGSFATFTDITQRKQVEEALKESEEKYRLLVENANEVILVAQDGLIEFVNHKSFDLIGFTPEELSGNHFAGYIHPEDRKAVVERHLERLSGKELPGVYPLRIVTKAGRTRWVEISALLIEWKGKPATLNFLSDITERKHAEEERNRLREQLLQAQKMESIGRLAGGVAHDFNNMLAVILGNAEMALAKLDPSEPLYARLAQIRTAAQHSADITRQLLAFARKQTIKPRILDLNETVEGLLNMLRRLIGEDIRLSWQPGARLWPVKMDPSQIDQILVNLCANSRDAISGNGKIAIKTSNATLDQACCAEHANFLAGNFVLLSVSDNGCGMDQETVGKLFEPFYTTKEVGQGPGLGLPTVYGIVGQNNGFIHVSSEPGQGATFSIYLPRHAEKVEPVQKLETLTTLPDRVKTILTVEDEPALLDVISMMLEEWEYTVLAAATPHEALRLAQEHDGQIDLLFTDIIMPQMNGLDLAKRMMDFYPHIKTLFMSGYTADVIAQRGVLDEGLHFIKKPFSPEDLAIQLRQALGEK